MISPQTNSPLFLYSARKQFENLGDALINRELIRQLRLRGDILAWADNAPTDFLRQIGLEESDTTVGGYRGLIIRAVLASLRGRRVYIVQTPGELGGTLSSSLVLKYILFWVLSLCGVGVIQVGASLGDFSSRALKAFAWASRYMVAIGLRDALSLEKASAAGFHNFLYFPDLAFSLSSNVGRGGRAAVPGPRKIAICLRDLGLSEAGKLARISAIRNQLEPIRAQNSIDLSVVVQVTFDDDLANYIAKSLPEYRPKIIRKTTIDGLQRYYAGVDMVVTDRLHAFLLAGLSGALPVALVDVSEERKITGILRNLELSALVIDLTAASATLAALMSQRVDLTRAFRAAAELERERMPLVLDRIFEG